MEFPRVMYQAAGVHCLVLDSNEYARAVAAGYLDLPPAGWNDVPDPDNPGATLPLPPISLVPDALPVHADPVVDDEADALPARRGPGRPRKSE